MTNQEKIINIMNLVLSVNNQNTELAAASLAALDGIVLSDLEKQSIKSYEDSLIESDNINLINFIKSDLFLNQNILDVNYITILNSITKSSIDNSVVLEYANSDLTFEDPYKQYRYCYLLSQKAISSLNVELIEKTIQKMHDFNIAQPGFIAPEYGI
jgi:hypothetical protein